jgi:hypothetical protein
MNNLGKVHALNGIVAGLIQNARSTDFRGFDPFDGLNSRMFKTLAIDKIPFASVAWLQIHKRSPLNMRALIGVERARNPKGIALFVLGFLRTYRHTKDNTYLDLAINLGDWLLSAAVKGLNGTILLGVTTSIGPREHFLFRRESLTPSLHAMLRAHYSN